MKGGRIHSDSSREDAFFPDICCQICTHEPYLCIDYTPKLCYIASHPRSLRGVSGDILTRRSASLSSKLMSSLINSRRCAAIPGFFPVCKSVVTPAQTVAHANSTRAGCDGCFSPKRETIGNQFVTRRGHRVTRRGGGLCPRARSRLPPTVVVVVLRYPGGRFRRFLLRTDRPSIRPGGFCPV